MLFGCILGHEAPLATPAVITNFLFLEDWINDDGILSYLDGKIIMIFTPRAKRIAHAAIDQLLKMRDPIWFFSLENTHHAFFRIHFFSHELLSYSRLA